MNFFKKVLLVILSILFSFGYSSGALALSNKPGSDPTGKSQRYVIEKTPWLDPTACGPTTSGGTSSAGPASPGQTWFMGDSLTYGLKDFGGLEEKLTAKGFTPNRVNDRGGRAIHYPGGGGTGQEAGTGLEAVDNDADFIRQAKNIVIALGTNDANGTATVFNGKQEELLNKIKAINPNAKIFWVDVAAVGIDKEGGDLVNTNIYDNITSRGYSVISQFKYIWGEDQDPKKLSTKSMPDPNNQLSPADGIHYSGGAAYQAYADFLVNQLASGGASAATPNAVPGGCECQNNQSSGNITLIGDSLVEQAFNFYIGKGLSANQSAAIVGNLMLESGGNTTINPDITNEIGAYGIAQWLGGRKTALEAYAASQGKPRNDLGIQLEFLWIELPDQKAASGPYRNKSFLEATTADTPIAEAAVAFENTFERSGGAGIPQRISNAESVFASFGSNVPGGGGSSGGGSNPCGPSGNSTLDPNLPQGTREELFEKIKQSGKVTANVELLGDPSVKATILAVVLRLTEKYSFSIGSVMRPGDVGSAHADGRAVDLGNINGQGVPSGEDYEGYNQVAADFIKDAASIIPAGGSYIGTPNSRFEAIVQPIITSKGGTTLIETRANGLAEGAHFHLNVPAGAP